LLRTLSKFVSWLVILAPKAATADDMLQRFGPTSPVGRQLIGWLYDHFQSFRAFGIVGESFDVWKGLYKEATNLDEDAKEAVVRFAKNMGMTKPKVEEFLFAVETFMAVLMKLLVAEVALQKRIVDSPSLRNLLGREVVDGYRSLSRRVAFLHSIFEEDIFDWFLEPTKESKEVYDQASMNLVDVADALDNLDFTALKTDLIRDLYHGFFDPETRKALGEFYTSEALVDQVLDSVRYVGAGAKGYQSESSVLVDPSCGSGTFLVKAIARWKTTIEKSRSNPQDAASILKKITSSVLGIDIHPFAVAMARANYIVAIIELLSPEIVSRAGELSIPIYWTDSLVIRESSTPRIDKGPTYKPVEVQIPALGKFVLPRPQDIDWRVLAASVRRGLDSNWSEERFLEEVPKHERLLYREILRDLYRWFKQRQVAGKDGRWISILTNALTVHQLQEKCDFVVGNPPWVRIHKIDGAIRDRLKEKFQFYRRGWTPGLVKTQGRFKEQYDYCMAFVESGLRLLTTNGKLGFVITSKVMQSLYAGSMRKSIVEQCRILLLKDYSLSEVELFRDATNYPLILAVQKSPPQDNVISVEVVAFGKKKPWKVKQSQLPVVPGDTMSPWMMAPPEALAAFRQMQMATYQEGFTKNRRLGDVYDVHRGVMTSLNEVFLVTEITRSASPGIVVAKTEGGEEVTIEEELLRPVLRGGDISKGGFKPSGYVVWTHDDKTGEVLPKLPANGRDYFNRHKDKLSKRDGYNKGMPIWTILRVSKEKLGRKVGWQELDKQMGAVQLPVAYDDSVLGKRASNRPSNCILCLGRCPHKSH